MSNDYIGVADKKHVFSPSFMRQLLLLFDSEDFRERDYLKNVTHRMYSKLTQRRALIRRSICNTFFEVSTHRRTHLPFMFSHVLVHFMPCWFAVPVLIPYRDVGRLHGLCGPELNV